MKRNVFHALLALAIAGATCGCHSRYVEADVHNATDKPVTTVEVDYPSASFGRETLAAGATYHYRFKILGRGSTSVTWMDTGKVQHTVKGPELYEGQEGHLSVTLMDKTASFQTNLQH